MTRSDRLRALIDLNYPPNQRMYRPVCTDCGSISIVSRQCHSPAARRTHYARPPTRQVRRRHHHVERFAQSRHSGQPNAIAQLLFGLASIVAAAALVRSFLLGKPF